MDNVKMGEIIREARKKKSLTQKDIASHLNITDRAVSKWERGICAPDLALLEPLAEILGISITELITGETVELAVKETIQYSKLENQMKGKQKRKRIIIILSTTILLCFTLLLFLVNKGVFHKIGTYSSPDGTIKTTVYNCNFHFDKLFPTMDGFTVKTEGQYVGNTTYLHAEFQNIFWSPDSKCNIINMYINNETHLELVDYARNRSLNLTSRLGTALYENDFFSNVPYDEDGRCQITFEFIQWSNEDPSVMLIYFSYEDVNDIFHEGYMWYDYITGESSGEMELEQGDKELNVLDQMWNGIE